MLATKAEDAVLKLPAVLDLQAAAALREQLLSKRGLPLRIEAAEVQRLGAQCLQVLLAAQRSWAAEGLPLHIDAPSEDFTGALKILGLAQADLEHQKELAQ